MAGPGSAWRGEAWQSWVGLHRNGAVGNAGMDSRVAEGIGLDGRHGLGGMDGTGPAQRGVARQARQGVDRIGWALNDVAGQAVAWQGKSGPGEAR